MENPLLSITRRNRAGDPVGIYSVCSAHPVVLEAAISQALSDDSVLLIEATSNQVDQFGGYTGMLPADFRQLVFDIADRLGFPRSRVILGGDHLGPNAWQKQPAAEAMKLADDLVEAYVLAGYTKIHIDCSMSCADDPTPVGDAAVAERTTRLLLIAEAAAARAGTSDEIVYVIGTEVPVPGGAHETLGDLQPTTPQAARATLETHRQAFEAAGLSSVWAKIVGIVVQPAVEFDHLRVIDYRSAATQELRGALQNEPWLVFEAHSTDYQTTANLSALVRDHWAILKVGPGLTFAMREALFALARIELELVDEHNRSNLIDVVERRMLDNPRYWEPYYEGDAAEQRIARRYSYSDRLRYYWPDPEVAAAEKLLYDNLSAVDIPLPMISQFLPEQYWRVRAGELSAAPHDLVVDKIRDALRPYASACLSNEKVTTKVLKENNLV
jgi:D-tagatose-1,6-bisphosphate aldolase subunit GatZ/KbaZ